MRLEPREGRLSARVAAEVAPAGAPSSTIDFFLNRGLIVGEVTVQGERPGVLMESDVERFPFAPTARRVTVTIPEAAAPPAGPAVIRRYSLEISYAGTLAASSGGPGQITSEFTELNLYGSWFPLFQGPQGFDYDVEIELPRGYDAANGGDEAPASPGSAGEEEAGLVRRRFVGRSSAGDVAILVTSGYRHVPVPDGGRCEVDVWSTGLPGGMQERAAEEASWACDFMARGSGAPDPAAGPARPRLLLVIVPREDPGYARPPLVVAPAGWFVESGGAPETDDEEAGWRRRLFHEIAHGFAPLADTLTHDDWINEGLAEHLALQALAERRGDEAAARYYRRFILEIAERPPTPADGGAELPAGAPASALPGEPGASEPETGEPAPVDDAGREPDLSGAPPRSVLLPAISAIRRSDPDASLLYYRKGALIFRMIEGLVGAEEFTRLLADLRRRFPVGGAARLTSAGLERALEETAGEPFGWLGEDWIDGTSLPRLGAGPAWGIERMRGGTGWRVRVEIEQSPGRVFSLRLPVVARRGASEARRIVAFSGRSARADWILPFKPAELRADPERLVPRFDETVDLALILRAAALRMRDRTAEGIRAERRRDPGGAIARYEEAAAEDPAAPYPLYRKGRALVLLGELEPARRAHEASLKLGEREAEAWERASRKCASAPAMACSEPILWADAPYELRAWNWIRIGEIDEMTGRHDKAAKAFRNALGAPDRLGAHDKALSCLRAPCVERASPGDPGR